MRQMRFFQGLLFSATIALVAGAAHAGQECTDEFVETCPIFGPIFNCEAVPFYADFLGSNWLTADYNSNGILDQYEFALFTRIVCDETEPENAALVALYESNLTMVKANAATEIQPYVHIITAFLTIGPDNNAFWQSELVVNTKGTVDLLPGAYPAFAPPDRFFPPLEPLGDVDRDNSANICEFQKTFAEGGNTFDYANNALNPAVLGEPDCLPVLECRPACEVGCAAEDTIIGPAGVESALANVYAIFATIDGAFAGNVDTLDVDGNGIPDLAQARLMDAIAGDANDPAHCCVIEAARENFGNAANYELAEVAPNSDAAAVLLNGLESTEFATALTGIFSFGERGLIDALFDVLDTFESDGLALPDETDFDLSAEVFLAARGNADADGTCNLQEYNAQVSTAPDDFDAFVAAARDDMIQDSAGPCPPCEGDLGFECELDTVTILSPTDDVTVAPGGTTANVSFSASVAFIEEGMCEIGDVRVNYAIPGTVNVNSDDEAGDFTVIRSLPPGEYTLTATATVIATANAVQSSTMFSVVAPVGEGEGSSEGEGEGSVMPGAVHSADFAFPIGDRVIILEELVRVIQLFNSDGYSCAVKDVRKGIEDGYVPGPGNRECGMHATDYNPANWEISLSELLRLVQFFNVGGYVPCPTGEDGFCPDME